MNKQYLYIIAVQSLMIRILGNLFSPAIIYERIGGFGVNVISINHFRCRR